jgi:signal transduction histidine kinase
VKLRTAGLNHHEDQDPQGNGSAADAPEANERVQDLIEQLKLRSAELEGANRELRRVSHYRSLFLARMSHELRTPLTSILGFSEILLDQEMLTEPQRRFCKKIQDSGMQLQTSLNQLVDLSRVEAGQTEVFLQEFPVRETFERVVPCACAVCTRAPGYARIRTRSSRSQQSSQDHGQGEADSLQLSRVVT